MIVAVIHLDKKNDIEEVNNLQLKNFSAQILVFQFTVPRKETL